MKIGIIGDIHLGVQRGYKEKNIDGDSVNYYRWINEEVFKESIELINNSGCEVVVFTGDVFHSANPQVRDMITFKNGLNMLERNDSIKDIYLVAGNHDIQNNKASQSLSLDIFELGKVHIVSSPEKIEYKNANDEVETFVFSPYPRGEVREIKNTVKDAILFGHGYLGREDSVECINYNLVRNFKSIFLGHIHLPKLENIEVGGSRQLICYPGSLMPSNQSYEGCRQYVYVYDTKNNEVEKLTLTKSPTKVVVSEKYTETDVSLAILFVNVDKETASDKDFKIWLYRIRRNNIIVYLNVVDEIVQKVDIVEFEETAIPDFWKFIEENHSDMMEEFKRKEASCLEKE